MNKIERMDCVLNGLEVDRPPVALWYHFGVQHAAGEQFAKLSLQYFDHYDFDFLKLMNDYFYPVPRDLDVLRDADDLKHFQRFEVEKTVWKEQLKAVRVIASALDAKAYFIDTVFDPWQTVMRHMAGEKMQHLMANEPNALLDALEIVTDNLVDYCKRSIAAGSAGIFLSVPAAAEILSRDDFLTFVKPFSQRILQSINGLGRMNTTHIHGEDLFFEDVLDLPTEIFSWWDRGPKGPSLAEIKDRTDACVMGGIDQTIISKRSRAFIRRHVSEGIESGGNRKFILANGCSIKTWIYPGAINTIVETVKNYGRT